VIGTLSKLPITTARPEKWVREDGNECSISSGEWGLGENAGVESGKEKTNKDAH